MPDAIMKSHLVLFSAVLLAAVSAAEPAVPLERFAGYRQGEPLAHLIEAREAVFAGTGDEAIRAARERDLLAFIASDAQAEAKAIAMEWLGLLGSSSSVPALAAALETPALASAAAAALARIPGPDAEKARLQPATNPLPTSPQAAEVERFLSALAREPPNELVSEALASPNELLAGAALLRIRAGEGAPDLAENLMATIDRLPAHRQVPLLDALATRTDAIALIHPSLVARARAGDASAITALGRILRPDDLPMVMEVIAKPATPELASAAAAALARATDPGINPELVRHAAAAGPGSLTAIDTLAARHATESIDALWSLTTTTNAGIADAAFKALGAILPPDSLTGVIDKLAAAAYEVIVTIEVHGYFTTKPDYLERMLALVDSPWLRINLDTGNSFIAGQDPVAFCRRFADKVAHVHVKDVSESLAAIARGGQTGIALSHCAVGDGVNAGNIRECLRHLQATGYTGHLSIECEGQGGPLLTQSLQWLRATLAHLGIPEDRGNANQ